jgi:hypothetical protein
VSRFLEALPVLLAVLATAVFIAACTHVGVTTEPTTHARLPVPIHLQVEQCVDRTEIKDRDLGKEATQAFLEKLGESKEFLIQENSRYRLACEVTGFVEGSAIKRWVLPGWGATVGQVSAMLTDSTTGEILIIAEGNASVSGGGLYTIGAETYIVPSAVDDVMERLRAWARGEAPDSGAAEKGR